MESNNNNKLKQRRRKIACLHGRNIYLSYLQQLPTNWENIIISLIFNQQSRLLIQQCYIIQNRTQWNSNIKQEQRIQTEKMGTSMSYSHKEKAKRNFRNSAIPRSKISQQLAKYYKYHPKGEVRRGRQLTAHTNSAKQEFMQHKKYDKNAYSVNSRLQKTHRNSNINKLKEVQNFMEIQMYDFVDLPNDIPSIEAHSEIMNPGRIPQENQEYQQSNSQSNQDQAEEAPPLQIEQIYKKQQKLNELKGSQSSNFKNKTTYCTQFNNHYSEYYAKTDSFVQSMVNKERPQTIVINEIVHKQQSSIISDVTSKSNEHNLHPYNNYNYNEYYAGKPVPSSKISQNSVKNSARYEQQKCYMKIYGNSTSNKANTDKKSHNSKANKSQSNHLLSQIILQRQAAFCTINYGQYYDEAKSNSKRNATEKFNTQNELKSQNQHLSQKKNVKNHKSYRSNSSNHNLIQKNSDELTRNNSKCTLNKLSKYPQQPSTRMYRAYTESAGSNAKVKSNKMQLEIVSQIKNKQYFGQHDGSNNCKAMNNTKIVRSISHQLGSTLTNSYSGSAHRPRNLLYF